MTRRNLERGIADVTRQRVSEAVFLIGVGTIWAFDVWWPGILVVCGLTWSTSLAIQRKFWAATMVAVLLCALPIVYLAAASITGLIPALVAGAGVAQLARALFLNRGARAAS